MPATICVLPEQVSRPETLINIIGKFHMQRHLSCRCRGRIDRPMKIDREPGEYAVVLGKLLSHRRRGSSPGVPDYLMQGALRK